MTDHLNVDVALCEGLEHPSRHTHQLAHLFPDKREDRHVSVYCDLFEDRSFRLRAWTEKRERENQAHRSTFLKFEDQSVHDLSREIVFDRHSDVHLTRTDQVDDDTKTVECTKDTREEAVGDALPVRIHIENDDAFLDGDCRGETFALMYIFGGSNGECPYRSCCRRYVRLGRNVIRVRVNDCSSTLWVLYILYPDGYVPSDDLEEVDIVKMSVRQDETNRVHEPAPW